MTKKKPPTKKTPTRKKKTRKKTRSAGKAVATKRSAARDRKPVEPVAEPPIEESQTVVEQGVPGPGLRIAMWSGPRNISTAMMRAWDSRPDTAVLDEPFYAHYLKVSQARHPGADEIMDRHETNWRQVVARITGPIPRKKAIWYQKHMAHHLLPTIDRSFLGKLTNCFLIRDPIEMLTSLSKAIPVPTALDTGLPQQVELFEQIRRETGHTPPVLDARSVLENPTKMLGLLCDAVGVEFDEKMLTWKTGSRPTDGVWGPHWYASVYESTRFNTYQPKNEPMTTAVQRVYRVCCGPYQRLFGFRLR